MIANDPEPMSQHSVRLRPPIDATMADIDEMLRRLQRVLLRLSGEVNDSHGSTD
jgi:acetylornithine/succinyldiaminopimelate/putrescine aminotransferase